jgi:hypothetical protein
MTDLMFSKLIVLLTILLSCTCIARQAKEGTSTALSHHSISDNSSRQRQEDS